MPPDGRTFLRNINTGAVRALARGVAADERELRRLRADLHPGYGSRHTWEELPFWERLHLIAGSQDGTDAWSGAEADAAMAAAPQDDVRRLADGDEPTERTTR